MPLGQTANMKFDRQNLDPFRKGVKLIHPERHFCDIDTLSQQQAKSHSIDNETWLNKRRCTIQLISKPEESSEYIFGSSCFWHILAFSWIHYTNILLVSSPKWVSNLNFCEFDIFMPKKPHFDSLYDWGINLHQAHSDYY